MKKICHLTSVHIPFDTRIFHKEAKSLASAGYNVSLIARHNHAETVGGVRIIPIPAPANRFERMSMTALRVFRLAHRERADLYHFHDPELLPVAAMLKLTTGARLVYDVHEDYARQMSNKHWLGGGIASRMAGGLFTACEKTLLPLLDGVVTVTADIAARYPQDRTVIVKNYVSLDMIDEITPVEADTDLPILVYGGHLERDRGICELINIMDRFVGRVQLWLLGKWDEPAFEAECRALPGWKHIRFFGEMPVEEAYAYYKRATIGLHCVLNNAYYLRGLPTKMFEYAACGLPAIISRSPWWEEIFRDMVEFTDPSDPDDLAGAIEHLIGDSALSQRLGANARTFVERTYNWEKESETLLTFYRRIFSEKE